jgi:aryl-alcohol dehydrogenase-like predicted oxidoreductase
MSAAHAKSTEEYFASHPAFPRPQILGKTGLSVSRVGFGSYRIHQSDPDHREALKTALLSGVNLIDTSTNYMDGSSERLIGEVLKELFESGQIKRAQTVIVSKVGYVQGQNLKQAKSRIQEGHPYPEMTEVQADCWHCISPEFLEDQISGSLTRLQLEKLDVLLLHNPEYSLKTSQNRELFYERIRKAFVYLESEVTRGRIQHYGISSNSFPELDTHPKAVSVERCLNLAKEIKKSHHFSVIQFPMNLFESGAALNKNNLGQTVLEFAVKENLGTLINRPFNASYRNRLLRLTSFPRYDEVEIKGELHRILGRVIELEKKFSGDRLPQGLMWGQVIRESLQQMDDILNWKEALYHQILPSLDNALERLQPNQESWGREYRENAILLLSLITKNLETLAAQKADLLAEQLTSGLPELASTEANPTTLSQKALQLYLSLPGVDCVLVGMRQLRYVQDVIKTYTPLPKASVFELLIRLQKNR